MGKAQEPPVKGMYRRGRTWWLRFTRFPNGPQERVSLGTRDEDVAAVEAVRLRQEVPLSVGVEFVAEMERYFAERLADRKLTIATVTARRPALMEFSQLCDISRPADITVQACERWVRHCRAKLSPLTVQTYLTHVAAFCTWLVRKKKMRENPARQISLGKAVFVPRKNFLESAQIRDLIAAAPDDSMRFVLFSGFHAGLRKMEITEARPDWFRLSSESRRGVLHVQPTDTYVPKDKEDRTIPLTTEFDAFLRAYLPTLPAGSRWAVYPTEKGKHAVYRVFIGQRFRAYMAAQGVRCTMHDMRRSFVSNKLIENGTLIYKLAKWTGTDIRTLQNHYGHLLSDDEDIEAGV